MSGAAKTIVVRRFIAPTRLAMLVDRPGGKAREHAIADATRNLEQVKDESLAAAQMLIGELEAAFDRRAGDRTPVLKEMERLANQIITIAGTFEKTALSEACKRLCDVIFADYAGTGGLDPPLAVCVRTIRLFAPGGARIDPASEQRIHLELRLVLDRLGIQMPADAAD